MSDSPHVTPRMREALFYRVVLGLTRKETGLIMGISPFTVRNYERRAEKEFGAENWHNLGALIVATQFFSSQAVLAAREDGYPPLYMILSNKATQTLVSENKNRYNEGQERN